MQMSNGYIYILIGQIRHNFFNLKKKKPNKQTLACTQNTFYKWQNVLLNIQSVVSTWKLGEMKQQWLDQFEIRTHWFSVRVVFPKRKKRSYSFVYILFIIN